METPNVLNVIQDTSLEMTGVVRVVSFNEKEVVVKLGDRDVSVQGTGLHVDQLELGSGKLKLIGSVTSIRYTHAHTKGGFLKMLSK